MTAKKKPDTQTPAQSARRVTTLKTQDPINMQKAQRIATSALDDINDVEMSSPADETPSLKIFEVTLDYVPNLKVETGAMRAVQRTLSESPITLRETVTLVVHNTIDKQSPELEDKKRGLLVNVPVSYGAPDDAAIDYADPESVPSNIALYARCAAGSFQEAADDLVRVTAIRVHPVTTRELIYTL